MLGVLSTGSEYAWGTVKSVLSQGPRRSAVLAGKVVALGGVVLVMVLTSYAANAVASAIVASVESQSMDWPGIAELAKGIGGGWLIAMTWCIGGMALGVVLKGTTLAVGIGLVWALVIESLVRGFASTIDAIDTLQRWLPGTNGGALAAALGAQTQSRDRGTPGVTDVVSGTHGVVFLAAYIIAFACVAGILLQRRDVT